MHDTAMLNAQCFINTYLADKGSIKLADIGAQNVTGSIKDLCTENIDYIGVNFVEGSGVDVVLEDPYHLPFPDNTFDAVTASSCFEHSELFWELYLEMLRILKPSGIMYLNVPSNGRYHKYPLDCWRFYPDSGLALAKYGRKKGFESILLESYISKQIRVWNDFVCIILKDAGHLRSHTKRIIDQFQGYENGRIQFYVDGGLKIEIYNESEIPEDQKFLGWRINKALNRVISKVSNFNFNK